MAGPVLYSTNPWLSHHISRIYRGDSHFVWCGEYFDPHREAGHSPAAMVGYTSSPRMIYEQLYHSVDTEDEHCPLIRGYRKKFQQLAREWLSQGMVTPQQKVEITSLTKKPAWKPWRPVLYIIDRASVAGRLVAVPAGRRAAFGAEFQILDLKPHEFDMIEVRPI
ncbi:MAG: hypothetical protein H7840_12665 [Alphaproteobacteria bacterium]